MALWKESEKTAASPQQHAANQHTASPVREPERAPTPPPRPAVAAELPVRAAPRAEQKESIIAAGISIEGKIEGSGHIRIAGSFTGDIHVEGNLTIEPGAKLTGGVRAKTVTVSGELEGNIDSASVVELTATGMLNGDVKAGTLTVSAGSRMRGRVEFGWDATGASGSKTAKEGFGA